MPYMHEGKRNLLIWDGLDEGITEKGYTVTCPHCRSAEVYHVTDVVEISSLPSDLEEYLLEVGVVSSGSSGYEVKKSVPAYVVPHRCQKCQQTLWLVVGIKEVQPQRYNIFYKSTVYETGAKMDSGWLHTN